MIQPNYTLFDTPDALTLQWLSPHLSVSWLPWGWGLLLTAALLILFRNSLAVRLAKALYAQRLTPRRLVLTSLAFLPCGALIVFLSHPPKTLIRWDFTREGLSVSGPDNSMTMDWKDVQTARLEAEGSKKENSSLVLKEKTGRESWIVLKWLTRPHRRRVLSALAVHLPAQMQPVLDDKTYMESLSR